MARIYKRTDRVTVKIDEVTVKLAPLTLDQKTEIQQQMLLAHSKSDIKAAQNGISLALKYALKGLDGIEDGDGNPYKLQIEGDELTDECIDDLLNLDLKDKLTMVCMALVKGVPTSFTDDKNQALAGVEIVKTGKVEATGNV